MSLNFFFLFPFLFALYFSLLVFLLLLCFFRRWLPRFIRNKGVSESPADTGRSRSGPHQMSTKLTNFNIEFLDLFISNNFELSSLESQRRLNLFT